MKPPRTQKSMVMVLLLGLVILLAPLIAWADEPRTVYADGGYWLDAMTREVRIAEVAGVHGNFQPYLGQLLVMEAAFRSGDEAAIYAAMDRFMDMLENRENAISDQKAHWLFDYCYLVTPARYHDVSRHLRQPGSH